MVAQRDRDEPDAVRMRARGLGQLEDPVGGERPDRQVVVAGPAEAAQVRATAHHFDKEARTELRLRREDARRRRIECVGRSNGRFPNGQRRVAAACCRQVAGQCAVHAVLRLVERRHVEAALPAEALEQVGTARRFAEGPVERRHEHLAFTGSHDVGERRERLRVHERHGAADHHQRMVRTTLGGITRDAGQAQQREDVDVVPFERDREGDHVEVAHRRLRFERQQRRLRCQQVGQLLLRRQEHPLADDVVLRVEQAVDRLKAEVGHANPVRVREHQRDAQAPAVRLADVAGFLREGRQCPFALLPGIQGCSRLCRRSFGR